MAELARLCVKNNEAWWWSKGSLSKEATRIVSKERQLGAQRSGYSTRPFLRSPADTSVVRGGVRDSNVWLWNASLFKRPRLVRTMTLI